VNQDIDPESTDDFIGNLLRRDRWIERRARELLARQEAESDVGQWTASGVTCDLA